MANIRGAVAAVLRPLLLPVQHIRWKIIAPYLMLTAILAVGGTYIATRLVTGSLEERFENQLAEAGRVASDAVIRRERLHLEVVRGVAFTEGVDAAIEGRDGERLEELVVPVTANNQAELVEVLDTDGSRLFGARFDDPKTLEYTPVEEPADRSSWALVSSVIGQQQDELGDKFAQLVQTTAGPALYTSGPVYDGDELVGVVLVGSLLDSFLPVAKTEALADITFYDFDGAPLASTFAESDNPEEADLTPGPAVLEQAQGPGAVRESKTLFGRDFDLLYGELAVRDQAVGMYSVALPSSFILSAGSTTRWQMGIVFALATGAVMLTGWLVGNSLTGPLLRLVRAARAVMGGDLSARSGVRTRDEVGVLASSFDLMTERLQRQHLATIRALASAIDARDPYTAGHSARVGQLAVMIGQSLGLPKATLQHLEIGGYLHDIGKIGVRDNVLLKPGSLTEEERLLIERHPNIGLDILGPVELAPDVVQFVSGHHEKLDGSGYPNRRHGEQLSIVARIATIADIYDALTTERPYRGAMSVDEALAIMQREADDGKLDRRVLGVFRSLVGHWEVRRRRDRALQGFRLPGDPVLAEAA